MYRVIWISLVGSGVFGMREVVRRQYPILTLHHFLVYWRVGSVIYQGQNFGSYVSVVNHTPQSVHDVKLTVEVEQSSPHPVLLPLRERREGVADVQASRDTLLVRKVSMLPSGASMDLVSDTVLVAAAESACVPQNSV